MQMCRIILTVSCTGQGDVRADATREFAVTIEVVNLDKYSVFGI